MSKIRRIAGAMLLTAVIIADAFCLGSVTDGQVTSQAQIGWMFVKGHKTYHQDKTFKGCETGGTGCWMIASAMGVFTFSSEGVNIQ